MSSTEPPARPFLEAASPRTLLVLLLFVALPALWFRLGHLGLTEPSEGRYAEIGREMGESGDWVTPRLNYQRHLEKPPFAYWATAAGIGLCGPTEFGARCAAALCATAIVVLVFALGAWLFDPLTGLIAGLVLVTELLFFAVARTVTADIFTAFWAVAAVACFLRWYGAGEGGGDARGWRWGYYACLGGGLLTKGPAIFVPALLPVLVFLAVRRDREALRRLRLVRGLALSVAITVPWLVLAELATPGALRYLVLSKATSAVASSAGYHSVPWWAAPVYYVPVLLLGCMPWSFFLPAFAVREGRAAARATWAPLFLFVWWPTILVAFTLIAAKLPTYLLPIAVPVALVNGRLWSVSLRDRTREPGPAEWYAWGAWFALVAFLALAALATWALAPASPLADAYGWLPVLSGACAVYLAAAWRWRAPATRVFLTVALLLALGQIGISARKATEVQFSCVEPIGRHLQAQAGPDDAVVAYRCNIRTLPFYVRRRVILVDYEKDDDVFDRDAAEYRENVRFGPEALMALVRGPRRAWVVTKVKYREANPELAAATRLVDQNGSVVLLTNR